MSVKVADMKNTKKEAMTRCQGDCSQNFGGHFTFVGHMNLNLKDYNVSWESLGQLKGIRC